MRHPFYSYSATFHANQVSVDPMCSYISLEVHVRLCRRLPRGLKMSFLSQFPQKYNPHISTTVRIYKRSERRTQMSLISTNVSNGSANATLRETKAVQLHSAINDHFIVHMSALLNCI